MDAISEVTSECFSALSQLRELDGPVNAPEMVHSRICGFIDAMKNRARDRGLSGRDADDMAYAIVALADEIALGKTEPLRSFWMVRPLQLQYFNENVAGEGFFTRLDEIRRDARRSDVLRVYYLCLLFGFQGRFAIRGGELELMRIIDSLRHEIARTIEPADVLSPAGDPPDEPAIRSGGRNPFLWVALGIFAAAIAVFIGLRLSLDKQVGDLADRVEEIGR